MIAVDLWLFWFQQPTGERLDGFMVAPLNAVSRTGRLIPVMGLDETHGQELLIRKAAQGRVFEGDCFELHLDDPADTATLEDLGAQIGPPDTRGSRTVRIAGRTFVSGSGSGSTS